MKPVTLILVKVVSLIITVTYLVSILTGYINPSYFWPLTFLALAFPILALSLIVLSIGWLFINKKISLLFLLVFFMGYNNLSHVFALHPFQRFHVSKQNNSLRVISWNVRSFGNNSKHAEHPDSVRRKMINFLIEQDADVLLLQEFVEYHHETIYSNTRVLSDTLGYKYFYTSDDLVLERSYGPVVYGVAIFSKYPLFDKIKLNYEGLPVPESAIGASLLFKNKKIRFITTHLVSMNLAKAPSDRQDEAFKKYDSAFIYGTSKMIKLKHYDQLHAKQALVLKRFSKQLNEPVIIAGDFNSVPSSYTYQYVKGNLQDAFLKKGFGLGRTYTGLSPTLRIDFILADKKLKVLQSSIPKLYLSDHFPVITDVTWN